ncbi:glycosyltransferase 87 family protein [Aestuariimicrobium soli]|uniref:glycosyltransferase 87 family protein n=1 Tax=Aestuariimicrobium soli TaxID=2035834 RepID=UPI003EB8898F
MKLWLIARIAVFAVWLIAAPSTQGDVVYYYDKVRALFEVGPRQTLVEYPTPVIWLLLIPYYLGFTTRLGYVIVFVVVMLALDASFARSLWVNGGRLRGVAVVFWVVFLAFVGPTAYLRFDLVTATLAGWALLALVSRHHGRAGALIGLGAATKLWPALLWPALLRGDARSRLKATVAVFGLGGLLALASLIWAGWDRLLSPLTWQSGRHLQVESVWATPVMLWRIVRRHDYWVGISSFQAFEIWGPGANALVALATVSSYAGYALAVVAYVAWLRPGRERRRIEGVVLMLMVILVMIVTNKTFSPQYIIWLGGPLAAGLSVLSASDDRSARRRLQDERRLIRTGSVLLALTLLTQLVYPIGYAPLVKGNLGMTAVTLVLAARNLGIVLLLVWVVQWLWSFLRRGGDRPPEGSDPEPAIAERAIAEREGQAP